MGRWEPDAQGRLRKAAMELYAERGYEQTTVADIAERAGLTARTFFRYFADKREVFFAGSEQLQQEMVAAVSAAPADATALQAIEAALAAAGEVIGGHREFSRQRMALIRAHAELTERELIKMSTLGAALAEALQARGVPAPEASLAAQTGIAVFGVGFERWVSAKRGPGLGAVLRDALADLRALAAS